MGKENRTHIGFFLNLDKPSDREINHILQTIPTYVSKTSYIKRAVAFYYKNCNDNGGYNPEEAAGIIPALADNAAKIVKNNDVIKTKNERKEEKSKKSVKANDTKHITKEMAEVPAQEEENPPVKAESPNITEKIEEIKDSSSDDYIMNNNSDIEDDVDYDSFVEGLFS